MLFEADRSPGTAARSATALVGGRSVAPADTVGTAMSVWTPSTCARWRGGRQPGRGGRWGPRRPECGRGRERGASLRGELGAAGEIGRGRAKRASLVERPRGGGGWFVCGGGAATPCFVGETAIVIMFLFPSVTEISVACRPTADALAPTCAFLARRFLTSCEIRLAVSFATLLFLACAERQ